MADDGIYESYRSYCATVGVTPLGYEDWYQATNALHPEDTSAHATFHAPRGRTPRFSQGAWDNVVRLLEDRE